MEEFKRVLGKKFILLFIIAVLLNAGLFLYSTSDGKSISDIRKETYFREWIIEQLSDMTPEAAAETANIEKDTIISNKYNELLPEEKLVFVQQLNKIKKQLEYIISYPSDIQNIQDNADTLTTFSIFADEKSFTYNNIQKTAKDFKRVANVKVSLTDNNAVSQFIEYNYIYYIALMLNIFVIYELFGERENGMWNIIHTSRHGRTVLALKRIISIIISTFIVTAVLFFTIFIVSVLLYGTAALSAPVQNIENFSKFALPMSQIEYILYDFSYSFFALLTLTVLIWAVFTYVRRRNIAAGIIAIFMGTELLLYKKIQIQSVYGILKQINFTRFLKVNDVISTYANRGRGTFVISEADIMMIVMLLLFVIACCFGIAGNIIIRPSQKKSLLVKIADKVWELYQHLLAGFTVTAKEFHKMLVTGRGLVVIFIMVMLTLYFVGYGQMQFSDNVKELDNIYLASGGKDYQEITDMVAKRYNDYQKAVMDAQSCKERYDNKEADIEELTEATSTVSYYAIKLGRVSEFMKKQEYLADISEKYGVAGYMISDRGYEEIFGKYSTVREIVLFIILSVGIILIIAENTIIEYRTGMNYITNASRRGRGWIQIRRIAAGLILTILLFAFVYGVDMYKMYSIYGMPYIDAPLMSLTFMEGCNPALTIRQWLIIRFVKRFIMIIAIYIATYSGSKLLVKKMF